MIENLVYGNEKDSTHITLHFKRVYVDEVNTLDNRSAVYLVYSKDNELMYVGETSTLKTRLYVHLTPSSGLDISRDTVGYIDYCYLSMDKYERHIIESLLVMKYRPALNAEDVYTTNKGNHRGKVTKVQFCTVRDMSESGMSRKEVSEKTGIPYSTVSNMSRLQNKKFQLWEQERKSS
ncbi:GIY-YIG nuclease family protein [Bacillus altitudinis]|uniref:GIY-YIG nuclease family protein n=1 Tax=Bacillus altitudinis TaxID=293387 RepID=UPI0021019B20|nr:GIY-YIG nuclease family protein [Bacillus altitudinis]UTV34859.1 GIY-YIG nuclease family protein [Bacillus altitudinis]